MTAKIMEESGIDISNHSAESVKNVQHEQFDYVIIVCDTDREFCPIFSSSTTSLHWNIEDPAKHEGSLEEQREAFRLVREKLKELIIEFISPGFRTTGGQPGRQSELMTN